LVEPSKYTHYLYDGGGNRVKKITRTQGGSYTATTYIDGAFEYTKESSGFDSIPNLAIGTWTIGSYSSGGEQNILHIMGGATHRIGDALGDSTPAIKYNLSDHLGSSCVQLDTNGTTISLEEYYPFGETSFGSYAKKRYRFCGKEKDEESGLYYYGMRYYSAWSCRFVSVDPLAIKFPYLTPYQYASNDPIGATDLDGMESTKEEPQEPQNQQTNESTEQNSSIESNSPIENSVTDSTTVEKQINEHSLNKSEDSTFSIEKDSITTPKPLVLPKTIKSSTNIPQAKKNNFEIKLQNPNPQSPFNPEIKLDKSFEAYSKRVDPIDPKETNTTTSNKTQTTVKAISDDTAAANRVNKAIEYVGDYTYTQSRPLNFNDKIADCSEFLIFILNQTDPKLAAEFSTTEKNGEINANTASIQAAIKRIDNAYRTTNPKVGDIAVWGGHVELVVSVNGKNFTTIGMRGETGTVGPTIMGASKNGYVWLNTDYNIGGLASGDFMGFWTPPSNLVGK
jgi:RHS repeat-associated protein